MKRRLELERIHSGFLVHPCVALLGPRQAGKTTLARDFASQKKPSEVHLFDLEDPTDLAKFLDPKLLLSPLKGLVVIDEIQRQPDLFPLLRVLLDRRPLPAKFLILGSASPDLIRQSSESLAGRIEYLELCPFHLDETGNETQLWIRGGFPPSFLSPTDAMSLQWRKSYVRNYLERDIPQLGIRIPAETLRRFWMMLSHNHGQIFNASELGRSLNSTGKTMQSYLDILTGTFMVRRLAPWHQNTGKREVKSPKIFIRDSGIFHFLQNIESHADLLGHPKLGASWEGYAMEQVLSVLHLGPEETFFWAVHSQAELDLFVFRSGKRHGFEFKYSSMPKKTHSMNVASKELKLDKLTVIFPGEGTVPLDETTEAIGLSTWCKSQGNDP